MFDLNAKEHVVKIIDPYNILLAQQTFNILDFFLSLCTKMLQNIVFARKKVFFVTLLLNQISFTLLNSRIVVMLIIYPLN